MSNKHNSNKTDKPVEFAVSETEPKVLTGTVVNCLKLNIREEANKTAEILCTINKGEAVEVIEEESTDDFYRVIYGKDKSVSIYGFCMKDYIKLNNQ